MSSNKWYNLVNGDTPLVISEIAKNFTEYFKWTQIEIESDDYDYLLDTGLPIYGQSTNVNYILGNISQIHECHLSFPDFVIYISLDTKKNDPQTGTYSVLADNFSLKLKFNGINNVEIARGKACLVSGKFENCHVAISYEENFSAYCCISVDRSEINNIVQQIIKSNNSHIEGKSLIRIDKGERSEKIDWYLKRLYSCNHYALLTGIENHSQLKVSIDSLFKPPQLASVTIISNCLKYKSVNENYSRPTSGNYITMYNNKKNNRLNINIEQYCDSDVRVLDVSKVIKQHISGIITIKDSVRKTSPTR